MDCSNHLKQMGLAAMSHESAQKCYPSNGWGLRWVGIPERGFGRRQPGSWMYSLLPFMEQKQVHDMTSGLSGAQRIRAGNQMVATVLGVFNCPTRRQAIPYPIGNVAAEQLNPWCGNSERLSLSLTSNVARGDYACNSGSVFVDASASSVFDGWGPASMAVATANANAWENITNIATGVCYPGSQTNIKEFQGGTSHTLLFAEKNFNPDNYLNGQDAGDNENLYMGDNEDTARWTAANADKLKDPGTVAAAECYPPLRDRRGTAYRAGFGSAPSRGAQCRVLRWFGSFDQL